MSDISQLASMVGGGGRGERGSGAITLHIITLPGSWRGVGRGQFESIDKEFKILTQKIVTKFMSWIRKNKFFIPYPDPQHCKPISIFI